MMKMIDDIDTPMYLTTTTHNDIDANTIFVEFCLYYYFPTAATNSTTTPETTCYLKTSLGC